MRNCIKIVICIFAATLIPFMASCGEMSASVDAEMNEYYSADGVGESSAGNETDFDDIGTIDKEVCGDFISKDNQCGRGDSYTFVAESIDNTGRGVYGNFRSNTAPETASNYTEFPLALPTFLVEDMTFHGITLFGNMNTRETETAIATYSTSSLIENEEVVIELRQTHWRNSIYAADKEELSFEAVSVFAGQYSGRGRNNLEIEEVLLNGKNAYFASIDLREPKGWNSRLENIQGASLYWIQDEIVFVLTVFYPATQYVVPDIEMMLEIARSVRT